MELIPVILHTTFGDITIELNKTDAPITTENFLNYVNKGHYDGVIFHRVIENFMIQGGGFDKDMQEKSTDASIKNEANNGLKNDYGTIAMARTQEPHSASAQFFINTNSKGNGFLNFSAETTQGWGYAVFGKVTDGIDIVEKIQNVSTGRSGHHQDVPVEPVILEKAEVVEAAE